MEIDSLYMEFLRANHPTIASRMEVLMNETPSGATPEELDKAKAQIETEFNTLANDPERVGQFHTWEKIPQILRDRYKGRVPPEIMQAAAYDEIYVLREMEYHSEKRNVDEVRAEVDEKYSGIIIMPKEIAESAYAVQSAFAAAIVAGYTAESSTALALNYQQGQELFKEGEAILADKSLSDAERREKYKQWVREVWVPHHKERRDIIQKDWYGDIERGIPANQPEKFLINILGKFNAGDENMDKSKLVAILASEYMQKSLKDRQPQLLEYLQRHNIQKKLGFFKDEARDLLADYVLEILPESHRSKVMENFMEKMSQHTKTDNLSDEQQAVALAKNMSATKANVLPQNAKLSVREKMANMPSALNRGNERQA